MRFYRALRFAQGEAAFDRCAVFDYHGRIGNIGGNMGSCAQGQPFGGDFTFKATFHLDRFGPHSARYAALGPDDQSVGCQVAVNFTQNFDRATGGDFANDL